MKNKILKLKTILAFIFVFSGCMMQQFDCQPENIEKIKIVVNSHVGSIAPTILTEREDIRTFIKKISFGNEHEISVKHVLSGKITIFLKNGEQINANFEKRIFRFDNNEYFLSKKSISYLSNLIKVASNQALAGDAQKAARP